MSAEANVNSVWVVAVKKHDRVAIDPTAVFLFKKECERYITSQRGRPMWDASFAKAEPLEVPIMQWTKAPTLNKNERNGTTHE